jgi:hypothetical protein
MTLLASQTTASERWNVKLAILGLLLSLTLGLALFFPAGGHLLIDEGIYHLMVRSFASSGSLSVWNGYEEFPSPELSFPMLRDHDGRLFSQYPHLSTILATPFYRLAGLQGLTVLNAISFIALMGVTFRLALTLFDDRNLALNACLILVLGTYSWQYSQAVWPHALSMLFITGAVYLTVIALRAPDRRRSLLLATAAGLTIGFGLGVRLDVIFALPAVLLPFVFVVPWRPAQALAVCIGTVPGLAMLAIMNQTKFGTVTPFSYGLDRTGLASGLTPYLPITALGAVALATIWLATRPRGRRFLGLHRGQVALGISLLVLVLASTPTGWQFISKLGHGLYQLVADLRVRDPALGGPGLTRSPGGGLIYLGSLKKALLQSCPYLVILVLPLAALVVRAKDRLALGILFLVPPAYVVVYSYLAWHGGLAFHLRYFLPILPFSSILTAYALRELAEDLTPERRRVAAAAGLTVLVGYLFLITGAELTLPQQEAVFLTFPMVIACALLVLAAVYLRRGPRAGARLRCATAAALAVGLTWAGMVALTHDAPRSYMWRKQRAELVRDVAPLIEADSILLAPVNDDFFGLLEHGRIRLATPRYDDYRDFRALVDFHLEAGRPVYLWLDPGFTAAVETRGLLHGLHAATLYEHRLGVLKRVTAPSGSTPPG